MDQTFQPNEAGVGKDFQGRIGRASFFLRFFAFLLMGIVVKEILIVSENFWISAIAILFSLGLTYWMLTFSVKRAHDFGASGMTGWLMLIPIANLFWSLVLLFRPGSQEENAFGPSRSKSLQADVDEPVAVINEKPTNFTEREAKLEDIKQLYQKGLLTAGAYQEAQLEILRGQSDSGIQNA